MFWSCHFSRYSSLCEISFQYQHLHPSKSFPDKRNPSRESQRFSPLFQDSKSLWNPWISNTAASIFKTFGGLKDSALRLRFGYSLYIFFSVEAVQLKSLGNLYCIISIRLHNFLSHFIQNVHQITLIARVKATERLQQIIQ